MYFFYNINNGFLIAWDTSRFVIISNGYLYLFHHQSHQDKV